MAHLVPARGTGSGVTFTTENLVKPWLTGYTVSTRGSLPFNAL